MVIGMDCPELGLIETHPSDRKAWSGRIKSAVKLHPLLYQYKLNSDNGGDDDDDDGGGGDDDDDDDDDGDDDDDNDDDGDGDGDDT